MIRRLTLAVGLVVLLAGCSAAPAEQPAPAPEPTRATAVPDVPIVSGETQVVRTPRPPVSVDVPAAGVSVPVVPVGLEADGYMELPDEVTVAGWYRFGPDPLSDAGTTVISAHVDSARYGLGPFAALEGLPAGTEVVVTVEGGRQVRYAIESVTSILKREVPLAEIFERDGAPRLVMITCGGQFDRDAFRYSDNVIVVATPVAP
ncbi:class F sortase [Pseudolysinimonas sp.]|jgi:sortase (surface protein transpeptidase)|uniref:class F sortase n=1 Tax=Pseudolysinimonas sp. TaxID=2680009 RepID=UPI003784E91E